RRSSSGRRLAPSPGRQCVRCVSGPSPGVVPTPAAETLVRIGEGSSRISQQLAEWFSQSSSISYLILRNLSSGSAERPELLQNQTEFRDSLRRMLTKPGVSVADLLQIQEKLAEAQAELDSEATQRKVLANETEKVYVEIVFHAEQRTISRDSFASVGEALRDLGSVL